MIVLNGGEVNEDIKSFRVRAEILLEAERLFLSQKAKCEYLKNSDKCSKFFHDLIKRNNKKNVILAINTRDGSITSNHSEIANEFVTFYTDLLGTKVVRSSLDAGVVTVGPCLSMDKYEDLLAPVTMIEITHLAYADDLLLFSRGDSGSMALMMGCLKHFGDMAGLRANILKSNIFMAGVDDRMRAEIMEITGFQEDNILAQTSKWPRNTLSHAGKLELIRSVLQGIECFWLSILPLPCGVIDKIYAICRKFLWNTKHPPISWATLCLRKESGGIGLKDLKIWNRSLLAKTLRKISCKTDSLWIKWVNHVYLNSGNIWNWQIRNEFSPLIKKLIHVKDEILLKEGSVETAGILLNSWYLNKDGLKKSYPVLCAECTKLAMETSNLEI